MIVRGEPSKSLVWRPLTLHRQLEMTAAAHGDRVALVGPSRRMTWAEVHAEARRFARGLMAAGVGKGDHIAVWLPNQIEWVLAWLGASHVGAVVVPINTRYKLEETRYILNQSDSRLLFLRGSFLGIDYQPMLDAIAPGNTDGPCPELRLAIGVGDSPPAGSTLYDMFLESGAAVSEDVLDRAANQVEPDDATIIVYTSGTTGRPKGAVHSHHVLRNEYSITEWMEIGTHSRILGHMPLFHVAGSFTGICPALITGGALVLMDHWDRTRALELIDREGITSFSGIPTHFIDLLTHPDLDQYDTSTLYSGWIGGASNPREVLEGAVNKLGVRKLYPVYGMTETTSVTTFPRPEDPLDVVFTGKGVPVSDFELKIVDTKSGADLAAGIEGEVCVRGHLVMQGYYKNPEATAAVIDERGMVPYRRPRRTRRCRLSRDHRAQVGHVHRWRLQRLSGRDRSGSQHASRDRPGLRRRCAGRAARRGWFRLRPTRRRRARRSRGDGLRQGSPCGFQGAAARYVRRRVAADGNGQDRTLPSQGNGTEQHRVMT